MVIRFPIRLHKCPGVRFIDSSTMFRIPSFNPCDSYCQQLMVELKPFPNYKSIPEEHLYLALHYLRKETAALRMGRMRVFEGVFKEVNAAARVFKYIRKGFEHHHSKGVPQRATFNEIRQLIAQQVDLLRNLQVSSTGSDIRELFSELAVNYSIAARLKETIGKKEKKTSTHVDEKQVGCAIGLGFETGQPISILQNDRHIFYIVQLLIKTAGCRAAGSFNPRINRALTNYFNSTPVHVFRSNGFRVHQSTFVSTASPYNSFSGAKKIFCDADPSQLESLTRIFYRKLRACLRA